MTDTSTIPQESSTETKPKTPPPKKIFSLANVKRVIEVPIHWPSMYPDFAPWVFKYRLALSKEIEAKRQEWLGTPSEEGKEQESYREQVINQTQDLLTDLPEGFAELTEYVDSHNPAAPGTLFIQWYASILDPEQRETVFRIIEAGWKGYWARVLPETFRQKAANSNS